jgi:hypothetical protein
MRNQFVRALFFVCILSIAVPLFAAPRHDESAFDRLLTRISRVVRHLLPLDLVDPTYPKP